MENSQSVINADFAIIPTVLDIMDIPIGLHPKFVEFFNTAKNCNSPEERQIIAKNFFDDFLTLAEYTQKTKYIQDVSNYEDGIKQLPVKDTISVVKNYKDLIERSIDKDLLLNNKSNQFDVFFLNMLERLYESLKDNLSNDQNLNTEQDPKKLVETDVMTASHYGLLLCYKGAIFSQGTARQTAKEYNIPEQHINSLYAKYWLWKDRSITKMCAETKNVIKNHIKRLQEINDFEEHGSTIIKIKEDIDTLSKAYQKRFCH